MEPFALLETPTDELCEAARELRNRGKGVLVTYSPKVFIPLTKLCRDVCHYCTFARPPRRGERAYHVPTRCLRSRGQALRPGATRRCSRSATSPSSVTAPRARSSPPSGATRRSSTWSGPRARARGDRPASARESGRSLRRRPRRAAPRVALPRGSCSRPPRSGFGAWRTALRVAGQVARRRLETSARRRGRSSVHERDPDRDRRDAAGADRGPARHPGGRTSGPGTCRKSSSRTSGRSRGRAWPGIPSPRWTSCCGRRGRAHPAGTAVNIQAPPNLSYDEFPRLLDAGSTTGAVCRR